MRQILRKLYDRAPFKKQIFLLMKKLWTPPRTIYQHFHFRGVIQIAVNESISFEINHHGFQIENEIFWSGLKGGWEKESFKLWIELCKEANTILDIGANTGVYSLIAKSMNSDALVYAFEPVSRVFVKLKKNIELNNFDIIPFELAVSNACGSATIFDTFTDHIYSVTVNRNLASPDIPVEETEITTISLNSFVEKYDVKKVDLLKIDVETHEPEVLEGFSRYLQIFKPTILIEVLNDDIGRRVQEQVQGLGYLYFNIDERVGPRKVETITKSDHYNYLLCNRSIAMKLGLVL